MDNLLRTMERGGPWKEDRGDRFVGSHRDNTGANAWAYSRLGALMNDEMIGGRAGVYDPINPEYYASLSLPSHMKAPNIQGTRNTPIGQFNYGYGDNDNEYAVEFTPRNYYLEELARRIMNINEGRL